MTSIVIWLNKEEKPCVWAASDSRITGDNYHSMSESCPKLFTVPLQVHIDQGQTYQIKVASVGYCYSGSSLIGQTSYIKLASLLGMLLPLSNEPFSPETVIPKLPSIKEIAELLKNISEESLKEICQYKFSTMSSATFGSELSIFGYCNQTNRFRLFSLINSPENQSEFTLSEIDLSKTKYYLMGDAKDKISNTIESMYQKYESKSLDWWRAPYHAMKEIVSSDEYETIGGKLQVLRAYTTGADVIFPVNRNKVTEGLSKLGDFITAPQMMAL